ncbi:DnaJ-like protein subfamily B member 4 [Nematocida sp. AWRm80]|nr:DnaJ-like protein subfamily B member 4 [Nematocida sp. AWRm80]
MNKPKVDLYSVLGLSRQATESEIKAAYKKLARKYHPDMHTRKSESEKQAMQEKFKEINNAYEVLTDKDKKAFYDSTGYINEQAGQGFAGQGPFGGFGGGDQGFTFQMGPGGFSFGDAFGKGFSFGDAFGGAGGGPFDFFTGDSSFGSYAHEDSRHRTAPPAPNHVVEYRLGITLEEMCSGTTKKLKITKKHRNGNKSSSEIAVNILAGYKPGTKITYKNAGDELPDGRGTDIAVILFDLPHPLYTLKGSDIVYEFEIGLKEALKGINRTIKGLKGNTIHITNALLKSELKGALIPDEGLPNRSKGSKRGNLIIKPRIVLDLSAKELEAVKRVLL